MLISALSAGTASAGTHAPQAVPPSAAPAEWNRYAESVTASVKQWLQADSETATRLRAYLDKTRPAPDQPATPIELKIWIDPSGKVTRIEYPPFADPAANADMLALVVAQPLPAKPPMDMLLPLRIRVQLEAPN